MQKKNILITGITGFLGSAIARELVKTYQVHGIVKEQSNTWRLENCKKNIIFHNVDLGNKEELEKVIKKISPQYIFHLAAYGNSSFHTDKESILTTNILGTIHLLETTLTIPYTCFINTGSSSEYGFKEKPMNENDVCEPRDYYATSKLSSTIFAQMFARSFKKPIVTLRPFSVYGPYEEENRFIPTIIRNLLDNKPISITASDVRRDFIYIDDVVRGYLNTVAIASKNAGTIINLGTGLQYSNDEVVQLLFNETGKSVQVLKGAYQKRSWDTSFWVADPTKMNSLLSITKPLSLNNGLKKTYEWYKENYSR